LNREYFLELAREGLCMPIGTDLVLREADDPEAVLFDGKRLGRVIEEAARRYRTPLAVHLMDLTVERHAILTAIGVRQGEAAGFHFTDAPGVDVTAEVSHRLREATTPRLQANLDAIRYIAKETDLLPVGSSIGPFSLATKLMAEPITAVYAAGTGARASEDPDVHTFEAVLDLACQAVRRSIQLQVEAGAQLMMVCEPAANNVYFSPNQLKDGSDVFERYAVQPNRRVKERLDVCGVDLMLHDCGELTDQMVARLADLRPAILSLGASRNLWEDAALVPEDVVLYGNLPTKRFISEEMTVEQVERLTREIVERMSGIGRPFILGSECDVLSVPGAHTAIKSKVAAMMDCACGAGAGAASK
jgi:uroporphyrinogen-III decarboxylase